MEKYSVKLIYQYSNTIEVEAESKEEAINIAQQSEDINEVFDCYYDAEANELQLKVKIRDVRR